MQIGENIGNMIKKVIYFKTVFLALYLKFPRDKGKYLIDGKTLAIHAPS